MRANKGRRRLGLVAGLITVVMSCILAAVVTGCGSVVTGVASSGGADQADGAQAVSEGAAAGLFDGISVHEIAVTFSQDDYEEVLATYAESGEKDWMEVTVTIDGQTYQEVGLRLKGNSSIMSLREGGRAPAGIGGDISTDEPEGLPWLIDLDKYADGQNHQGIVELAVRSNNSETALNEAVSLALLHEAGLASQQAAYVRFSVNGSASTLRLVIENPDDVWMSENFDSDGALYKAESTGDYSYRGEDPDSYDEVFDQEAGKDNADLTPLVEFLDFLNNSDDATFTAELPDWLDIDAFATYLAIQELIANLDDIDGRGNNSYLYYDPDTAEFTVVAWDHNLTFGVTNGGGAFGGQDRDIGVRPGVEDFGRQPDSTQSPDGTQSPDDMQPPEGAQRPGGRQLPGGQQLPDRMGTIAGSNMLVSRFLTNSEWQQLYQSRLAELRVELYESGRAAEILDAFVEVLKAQAADLVEPATVDEEAASLAGYFRRD